MKDREFINVIKKSRKIRSSFSLKNSVGRQDRFQSSRRFLKFRGKAKKAPKNFVEEVDTTTDYMCHIPLDSVKE
jgi:hypothetical protein